MDVLSKEDCKLILEKACPEKQFNVKSYRFENIENLVKGFLSDSKKLIIEYSIENNDKREEKSFFAKLLPFKNDFHTKYVLSTRGFNKEVFFLDKIKPNLDLWTDSEISPKCYLAVADKIVVLELLTDWKVIDTYQYLTEDEIKASIEALAVLHSSSMMCETKNSMDFKSIWGEYFFETLYVNEEGHLGYVHTCNGVKALKAIINFHCPNKKETKEKIFYILDNIPDLILPSTKFRNVISHGDLYNNNIMFLAKSAEMSDSLSDIDANSAKLNPPTLYPNLANRRDFTAGTIANVEEIMGISELSGSSAKIDGNSSGSTSSPLYPNLAEMRAALNDLNKMSSTSSATVSDSSKINLNPIGKTFEQLRAAGKITAKIIDFQLFRFNPPALDLLMLIYLTFDLENLNLNDLLDHYYKCVGHCMTKFGFDVNIELPKDEFNESVTHYRALALCFALLFRHYVNLPPEKLKSIMGDPVELEKFMLKDRIDTCLSAFHNDVNYRNILVTTLNVLFDLLDE